MKRVVAELISQCSFQPDALAVMQEAFDEACKQRDAHSNEHRAAIAVAIIAAYQAGERDSGKLLDVALAAAL